MPKQLLSQANLARFAAAARERLHALDGRLRKDYVRHFIERIEVGDGTITIRGAKAALAAGLLTPAEDRGGVPSFVPEWWAHQDSNLGPAD